MLDLVTEVKLLDKSDYYEVQFKVESHPRRWYTYGDSESWEGANAKARQILGHLIETGYYYSHARKNQKNSVLSGD